MALRALGGSLGPLPSLSLTAPCTPRSAPTLVARSWPWTWREMGTVTCCWWLHPPTWRARAGRQGESMCTVWGR